MLMPSARRVARAIGRCTIVVLLGAIACGAAAGTSGAAPAGSAGRSNTGDSASVLARTAFRNAVHAGWVHELLTTTGQGHTIAMVNDIGTKEGRQVVTYDGAHAEVIVIHGDAYFQADATALTSYFGISNHQALAGKWLELTRHDAGFSDVSDAVTLSSDFHNVTLKGTLTKGPVVTIDGVRAIPVHGHIPQGSTQVPVTLYVRASGALLPVSLRGTSSGGVTTTVDWSDWGHHPALAAPAGATAAGNLFG